MKEERRKNQLPQETKEAIKELVYMDDLTKLHNRRYLYRCLPDLIHKADKNQYPLSLFMLDVDKFKEINDTYGHLRGDKVLTEVADLLKENFREYDEIIRYAGDEFVIILPMTAEDNSLLIARRLTNKVSQYVFKADKGQPDLNLTLSLGLSLFPRDAISAEELIYKADEALYLSKRAGRNRVSVFTDVPEEILNKNKIFEVFPCQKLIDREKELEQLKEVLDGSFGQRIAKLILISADAGLGKTKLQTEFRRYAHSKETLCFSARCTEVMTSQPYQVLSANIERFLKPLKGDAKEILEVLPDEELRQLINLEPALKNFLNRTIEPKEIDEKETRFYLFKALIDLMVKLADFKPFLITFDDFQWIDSGTLNLINYLVNNVKDRGLCIVCGYRASELSERFKHDKSLSELFKQLKKNKDSLYLELNVFGIEETKDMIKTIFNGLEFDRKLNEHFYKRTQGNPYFIEEALKKLVKKGSIYFENDKWRIKQIKDDDIPMKIENVIQDEFKKLDEETKQFLSNAAIIGQDINIDILQKMIGRDTGYIMEMIDRAKRANIIDSHIVAGQEFFNFRNRMLWQLLYSELKETERNKLHEKFAQVQEKISCKDPKAVANILAYHYKKAKDIKRASDYEKIAKEGALKRFEFTEANKYLHKVLLEELEELKEEEGEEEEIALAEKPLERSDYQIVPNIISSLRASIINFELYPAGSKVRIDSVKELDGYFQEILNANEVISFSQVEGTLLVNGEELKTKDIKVIITETLAALLKNYRIQSISFRKGLSAKELNMLLETLSKKISEIEDLGGLPLILKKKKITNIKLNMVHYERILKKKLVQPQGRKRKINEIMLINHLLGRSEETRQARDSVLEILDENPALLAKILSEGPTDTEAGKDVFNFQNMDIKEKLGLVGQSLKKINEEISKEDLEKQKKYKDNLTQFILNLQPDLRSQVLKPKILKDSGISDDIMSDAFKKLPDNEIASLLKQECSRFGAGESNFDELKDCVRRFLPDENRRNKVLNFMKDDFSSGGIADEQFLNLLKPDLWHELTFNEKLRKIKSLSIESFLDQDVLDSTKQVCYGLLSESKNQQVMEILDKVFANLKSEKVQHRQYISANLESIIDILDSNDALDCLQFTTTYLKDLIRSETNLQIYSLYIDSLQRLISIFIKNGKFGLVNKLLEFLREEVSTHKEITDDQRKLIERILVGLNRSENVEYIIGTFKKKVERNTLNDILPLIQDMGEGLLEPIVNLLCQRNRKIDPYDAFLNRRYVAKILSNFGSKAQDLLKYKLHSMQNLEAVKNIIEVLGYFGDESCLETLKPYIEHQNNDLRRRTKRAISIIEGKLKK